MNKTNHKFLLTDDDLGVLPKKGPTGKPVSVPPSAVNDLDVVDAFHSTASKQAKAKGGRPKPKVITRTAEHGENVFVHNLHDEQKGMPVRVLMEAQVRNGGQLKSTVAIPKAMERRLTKASPFNKNQALVALADWALTELERQKKVLYVATEIVDEAYVPEEDFDIRHGNLGKEAFQRALKSINPDTSERLARHLDVALYDGRVKSGVIAALVTALENEEAKRQQIIEFLGPAAQAKIQMMGYDKIPSARAIVANAEAKATAQVNLDGISEAVLAVLNPPKG